MFIIRCSSAGPGYKTLRRPSPASGSNVSQVQWASGRIPGSAASSRQKDAEFAAEMLRYLYLCLRWSRISSSRSGRGKGQHHSRDAKCGCWMMLKSRAMWWAWLQRVYLWDRYVCRREAGITHCPHGDYAVQSCCSDEIIHIFIVLNKNKKILGELHIRSCMVLLIKRISGNYKWIILPDLGYSHYNY